jgi:CRISPR/Cas system CSM-associated protein Csm3 (group 7 of RAMP superfamily)
MDIVNIRVFPEPGDERGRLLRQLLQMLASGMVQVGARRTVGYGLVKLEQGRYEVYEVKGRAPREGKRGWCGVSQVPWSSHALLLREVLLEGYLVNRGPLRVGTGREPPLGSAVDLGRDQG